MDGSELRRIEGKECLHIEVAGMIYGGILRQEKCVRGIARGCCG